MFVVVFVVVVVFAVVAAFWFLLVFSAPFSVICCCSDAESVIDVLYSRHVLIPLSELKVCTMNWTK